MEWTCYSESMETESFLLNILHVRQAHFLCVVLIPEDKLLNYINNAGLFSQLTVFYFQLS